MSDQTTSAPVKEPLYFLPLAICPHCEQLVGLSPAQRVDGVRGPQIMAEGRCSCRIWNAVLPMMPAVSRKVEAVSQVEKPDKPKLVVTDG